MKKILFAALFASVIPLCSAASASAMTHAQWLALHGYTPYRYAPVPVMSTPVYPTISPLAATPYVPYSVPRYRYRHWHRHVL